MEVAWRGPDRSERFSAAPITIAPQSKGGRGMAKSRSSLVHEDSRESGFQRYQVDKHMKQGPVARSRFRFSGKRIPNERRKSHQNAGDVVPHGDTGTRG